MRLTEQIVETVKKNGGHCDFWGWSVSIFDLSDGPFVVVYIHYYKWMWGKLEIT